MCDLRILASLCWLISVWFMFLGIYSIVLRMEIVNTTLDTMLETEFLCFTTILFSFWMSILGLFIWKVSERQ